MDYGDPGAGSASFGYWLRRRRLALDLTQGALAEKVGCATVTIKKIEYDERRPSRQMARRIADALAIQGEERERFIAMGLGEQPVHNVPVTAQPVTTDAAPLPARFVNMAESSAAASSFVGREKELAQLEKRLQQVLRGNGQVLFITGGAGRGKTALMAEFSRRAQLAHPDLIVASGRCNVFDSIGDPYLPFRELLSLLTGDIESRLAAGAMAVDQAKRLWQLTPRTVQLLLEHGPHLLDIFVSGEALLSRARVIVPKQPLVSQLRQLIDGRRDTHLQQQGVFSEYTDLLLHLARARPLLLTLDDIHWADEASLGLLFHLSSRLAGSRVLIIGAYRPRELIGSGESDPHPLTKVLDELQRRFGEVVVNLTTADERAGRGFVDALLDSEPNNLGESFRHALFRQTSGHPFFTVELLRDLQSSGGLVQNESGEWIESGNVNWAKLPGRVEAVIAQRLGRLDETLQQILRVASVEGERFTVEVIAAVTGMERGSLVERLSRELVAQHRLLTALGVSRLDESGEKLSFYGFQHQLFQAYLYQGLDEIERAYLHEEVGRALEGLYGEHRDEIAVHLARHFEAAGHPAKAIDYLGLAGERALGLYAYEDAIDNLNRGLALCANLPETAATVQRQLDLLLSQGAATRKAGRFEESLATFQQAAGVARRHQLPEALSHAALGYEESRWRFNFPAAPAAALLEEALAALDDEESLLGVRLWVNLVRARMPTSSPDQFAALTQSALERARRIGDPEALYHALYLIVRGDRRPDRSAARLMMLDEMLQLSRTLGDPEYVYDTYGFRLQEFMEMGAITAVAADNDIVRPLAQKLHQPFYNYYPALIRVPLALFAGRFAEAEQAAHDALEIGRQMRVENVDGVYGMQMFSIRREQGRLPELAPLIRLLAGQPLQASAWRPGLALLFSELEMREEAREAFEALAVGEFSALPRDAMWITSIVYLAEVCAYLDDAARAAILYELLLPYEDRAVVVGFLSVCYGAASRYLGTLATSLRRWAEAERHFQAALEMNARMGARPWLARTRVEYARMLIARGRVEDLKSAAVLLKQAAAAAAELGMDSLAARVGAIQLTEVVEETGHR